LHAQYREAGVLLWRGFTLQEFANQLFSNKYDNGKGRQIPAHYGSKKHNYFTVASTIALSIEIFYIQGFDVSLYILFYLFIYAALPHDYESYKMKILSWSIVHKFPMLLELELLIP